MECKFSNKMQKSKGLVTIAGEVVQSEHLCYFESNVHHYGEFEEDVTREIKVGWLKWRNASGVLFDKHYSLN